MNYVKISRSGPKCINVQTDQLTDWQNICTHYHVQMFTNQHKKNCQTTVGSIISSLLSFKSIKHGRKNINKYVDDILSSQVRPVNTHSCSILSPWRRAYGLLWSSTISECRAMISSSKWLTSATCRTKREHARTATLRICTEKHYRAFKCFKY